MISIKNFFIPNNKESLIIDILKQKDDFFKSNSKAIETNFKLKENDFTKSLYVKYLKVAKKELGNFNLYDNNSNACWCLCTNIDVYKSVPHDHSKTSVINAVYYLNVPDTSCAIKFFKNNKWENYQPSNYELLIFPNYLVHDTEQNKTKEWRISINMEILCDYKWGKKI